MVPNRGAVYAVPVRIGYPLIIIGRTKREFGFDRSSKGSNAIILTGSAKEKPSVAEVISVGPGGNVDGKDVVMTVKPGDKVITSQYAGTKVTLEDVEYVVVRQNDILAIVE